MCKVIEEDVTIFSELETSMKFSAANSLQVVEFPE